MERPPSPLDFAPADALSYFQTPVVGNASVSGSSGKTLFGPDPNRVLVMISLNQNSGFALVGPTGQASSSQGYALSSTVPSVVLTYWQHGPIVTFGFDAFMVGPTQSGIAWILHSVSAWPSKDMKSPLSQAQEIGQQIRDSQRVTPVRGSLWQKWIKKMGG